MLEKILMKIFDLKDFSEESIKNSQFLELNIGGFKLYKINKNGFEKINEYLINAFEYSFDEIIDMYSLKANICTNSGLFNDIENTILNIIMNNKSEIFSDLGQYKIEQKDFDKINFEIFKNFAELNNSVILSDNILHNITVSISYPRNLYNSCKENYGIIYLMQLLFTNYQNDFEKWFLNTKNINLKVFFVYSCLNKIRLFNIFSEKNIASKIKLIEIINILILFKINTRFLPNIKIDKELKFTDILKYKSISENDKLYYLFFYIGENYRFITLNKENKQKFKELNKILNKFSNILQNLTEKDLKNIRYLGNYNISLLISKIKDKARQKQLYNYFIDNFLNKTVESIIEYNYDINRILESNIYGIIFNQVKDTNLIEKIKNHFNELCGKTSIPYLYYTNKDIWSSNISQLMYYLIVIFIYYKKTNKEEIKKYKQKFINIKGNLQHFFDIKENKKESIFFEILKQIK